MHQKKPELLAPAGDFEKLKFAINYGADAVYLGGQNFGLRANSKNFDESELNHAISYAHKHNVKVYVTVNIFANNEDIDGLKNFLPSLKQADAILVADPGIFFMVKNILPDMDIHISTQANVTNYESARFWAQLGAKRIVLARELSLAQIKQIHEKVSQVELEAFVHGAMCISYSGRCLLSNFLTSRSANHGDCAQPCRWKYNLVEETRPGEFFPIYENENGSFIMNSKDLCMVNHLDELIKCGVTSFKIEGRMKSIYYVAGCTKIYREAIDDYFAQSSLYYSKKDYYLEQLNKISHRHYSTGFYFGKSQNEIYESASYIKSYEFLGIVKDFDLANSIATIEQRNKIQVGDEIEILSPKKNFSMKIENLWDSDGVQINSAPHAQQIIKLKSPYPLNKMDIIRKKL